MKQSTPPSSKPRSIFRPEAVQRHAQGYETAVLPRFIAPPTFALLWIMLATLGIGLLASWFVQIPIFASGTAVVINDPTAKVTNPLLVAFLPATYAQNIAVGQTIYWQDGATNEQITGLITAVSPKIVSPAAIAESYPPAVGTAVSQPSVIVTATLETAVSQSDMTSQIGALYPVDVNVGSRRILSLLPFVGQFFDD
jgi:predicted RecA/RadA family phage recombinase